MSRNGVEVLTQKEIAHRWSVCLRTVRNERRRWRIKPFDFLGLSPLFTLAEIERAEARRLTVRSAA